MPGKVSPDDLLSDVFSRTGAPDEAVLQGPADGEDAAALAVGEETLVVSSDPISLATAHVGTLGVNVACNDVAVAGVDPRWLTVVLVLPDESALDPVTSDLDGAARELGVAIVGGHSEFDESRDRPFACLTAMGTGEFVPTSGTEPGDRVLLTKAAGIEGTAILAADFGDELGVDAAVRERAERFLDEISVVPDARALREHATAMHDPTEGGVVTGLQELARAADVSIAVDRDAIPVRPETKALADAAGVDPLRIFGSGAVLATVPEEEVEDALDALDAAGIDGAVIGHVREGGGELVLDGTALTEPVRDALYPLWKESAT
jgi:hydrogenase expression/formation protein HypE